MRPLGFISRLAIKGACSNAHTSAGNGAPKYCKQKRINTRCKCSQSISIGIKMVRLGGLEPPTSGATNLRSNQLSYNRTSASSAVEGSHTGVCGKFQAFFLLHQQKGASDADPFSCSVWENPWLIGDQAFLKLDMTFSAASLPGFATVSATFLAVSCMALACSTVTSACLRKKAV